MPKQKNHCAHCNAPLAEGSNYCEYCDLNRQGASRAGAARATRGPSGRRLVKIGLGVVSLACCAPAGIIVTLYETVYAIALDAPKYSARPPTVGQRPATPITAMDVFLDMRGTSDRSLSQRKQEWREKYEGRWVSWKGTVKEVRLYDAFASELVLQPEQDQEFKVEVNFDPRHNAQLKQLSPKQEVRVSGRLWGYYFMGDTVRLSEGALLEQNAPGQAQEPPR